MMKPDDTSSIQMYIRVNQGKYSRYAITQHLLSNGWSKDEIDRAWASLHDSPIELKPTLPEQPSIRGIALSLLLLLAIPACLLFFGDGISSHYGSGTLFRRFIWPINVLFVLTEVGLLVGAVVWLRRRWPKTQITALFLIVNFAWFSIILGTCFSRA